MKFWMAEQDMMNDVVEAETLADYVRIGFSRVDFLDKNKKLYFCYELTGDDEVDAYPMNSNDPMITHLNGSTRVRFNGYDKDSDGYTTIEVEEI